MHDGRRVWRWEMAAPMASYLATVVIAPMREQTTASPAGIPIRNFFPTAGYDADVRDFAVTGEMLDWFSTTFGPYPFGEYGAVVIDRDLGYALETQTMSIYGRDMLGTDPDGAADRRPRARAPVVRRLGGHPRAGPTSGSTRGSPPTPSTCGRRTSTRPSTSTEFMADLRAESAGRAAPAARPGPDRRSSPTSVYERGALALHALRRTVGDAAFFEILRTWTTEHRHATATTAQFIALAERVSGRSLRAFFDAWLRADAVPVLPADRRPLADAVTPRSGAQRLGQGLACARPRGPASRG